jgi:ABC-type uncharacterized transport system substrate-binding protein
VTEKVRKLSVVVFLVFLFNFLFSVESTAEERVVGVVFSADIPVYHEVHKKFLNKLRKTGYTKKIKFLYQKPNPDSLAWSNAVRKLIAYDATILITYGSGATEAATYETANIPIVYTLVYDPVKSGIKGRNLYGVGYSIPVTSLLRYLKRTTDVKKLGVLASEIEPSSKTQAKHVSDACKDFNMEKVLLNVKNEEEIRIKLKLFSFDALFITDSALLAKSITSIFRIINERSIPIVSTIQGTEDYSLINLHPDIDEIANALYRTFLKVIKEDRKVKGKREIVQRSKLIYNMKISKRLGLQPSIQLITGADRIIK